MVVVETQQHEGFGKFDLELWTINCSPRSHQSLLPVSLGWLCLNLEDLQLNTSDQQMLSGQKGLAQQKALSIVARMAKLQGATSLVDVKQVRFMARNAEMVSWRELRELVSQIESKSLVEVEDFKTSQWTWGLIIPTVLACRRQAHIDGCTYIGPASLQFAQKFLEWNAKVKVPTTLNAISVDLARKDEVPPELGGPAASLAEVGFIGKQTEYGLMTKRC